MARDFCSTCGAKFTDTGWPRRCASCGSWAYRNPIPVAVTLVPVVHEYGPHAGEHRTGLLVVRRGIPPAIGKLALPGGYMEMGESWEHGCAREVLEETGREVQASSITPFLIRTSPQGLLLIFGLAAPIRHGTWLKEFKPNNEVTELDVVYAPTNIALDLAFPLHTEAANLFFSKGR